MKSTILLALLLLGLNVQGELTWPEVSNLIKGTESISNVLYLSQTANAATYADKFEEVLQTAINIGRTFLKTLSAMMRSVDISPESKELVRMILLDIEIVQNALNELERNARLRNVMMKATAECVTPQRNIISKIKDETFTALNEVNEVQRDAFMDLMAASQLIQEQVRVLQDIEGEVFRALLDNDTEKAVEILKSNRPSAEKNIRIIQKTYMGAINDYNVVTSKSVKKLAEALQESQIKAREVLTAVDNCMKSKTGNGAE